jgi:hypothetical protein
MPNIIDLTTVAAVNGILAQGPAVDSALIQTEITAYSQNILTRTSRRNLSRIATYTEAYSGTGGEVMQLRNYPVLAVLSLGIGTQSIPASPSTDQPGFVIDQSGSQSAILLRGGGRIGNWSAGESPWRGGNGNAPPLGAPYYRFYEGAGNIAVKYQAGYALETVEALTVATSGPITAVVGNAAMFWSDLGVTLSDGTPLEAVGAAPGPLQYVAPVFGVPTLGSYLFNAAQIGADVNIDYTYGGVPFDLAEAAGRLVAVQYRRRQYLGQTSQMQPGVGTTAYSKLETELDTAKVIERYKVRFIAN